jgi:serine/threonine protein kinase
MLGSNVCCTAQLAPFIELRQNSNEAGNDGAERNCDVGDAVMFMKNEKIYGDRFYGQATLTPTTPGRSFVDLNPHTPLPLLTNLPDHLLTEAISGNCRGWLLGQGGFGKVDMLECPRWAVADKKINLGMTPTTLKYAELEAEIMASVDHPNIVSYITSGPDKQCNNFHIIMEWMSGGSLKDEIEKYGPFRDKSVIIQRVHDLLTGLAHLHESNIVHRDLKADNLMIGEHGELKIGDFGHARRLINGAVEANSVEGTVYYMAPEYVRTQQFTKACDIWSVGAVALEMVTGRPPWMHSKQQPQDTFASLFFKIGGTKSPPEIPDDLPWDLRDFCQRCLELDPSKRPSAAELLCHPLFKVSPCYGSTEKLTETLPAVGLVVDVESACGNALLLTSPEC